jgi:flagellar biogenesis protein FliO
MATNSRPTRRKLSPVLIGGGVLVIALGFGLPRLLPAPETGTETAAADAPPLGPALARLGGCLVLVCGLCVGVTRLANRKAAAVEGPMAAVASLRINPRCVVHLVQAGERRLLVGTDAGGVKALVELPAAGEAGNPSP